MIKGRTLGAMAAACAVVLGAANLGVSTAHSEETTARIALSGGLDRLDPSRTSNGTDNIIISQVYETLLELDPKTSELQPRLAEEFRLVSPTVWEFKLRTGVKFHNGAPFTAADVKYSIERILDEDLNSPHQSQIATISEVRIIDDHTIEIETSKPDPLLVRRFQPIGGSGRVYIVSKSYFEEMGDDYVNDNPVGTGPYRLETWNKGSSVTLVANADYWGEKPQIGKGVFTFIPENSTRVNALLAGEVDVIQRLPIADIERVSSAGNTRVISSPDGLVHTVILDPRKPPFDDIDVRKAFAHSLDMEDIVGSLLGEYGRMLGVPMGPNVFQFDSTLAPYAYDPELAETLLEGKTPIAFETYTSDGRYVNDREFYQAMIAQAGEVGFEITGQTVEWGRLISMLQARSGGPFFFVGWDYGEGDASKMNSFLISSSPLSMVSDPEYDRLAAEAGSEMDETRRTELWKQAQKIVYDGYYIAATWQASSIYGFANGFEWPGYFGDNLFLSDITKTAD